jgi:biopolymer transport protein ExbD
MAMSVGRPHGAAIAEINVTPMADVMIVLLIIFMVATPIIARPLVTLPDALHPTEHKGSRLEITLRRDGSVAVDGAPLGSADLLAEHLGARALAPGTLTVLIQADREASYSALAPVLAACRLAGVGEIALATEWHPER